MSKKKSLHIVLLAAIVYIFHATSLSIGTQTLRLHTFSPLKLLAPAEIHMNSSPSELEDAAIEALLREDCLNEKLGVGVGASKERAKIRVALDAYEASLDSADGFEEAVVKNVKVQPVSTKTKYHTPTQHIAVYGGHPSRRQAQVSRWMHPYASLSQYGSKDYGTRDLQRLLSSIQAGKLDVVYYWTRFSNHDARHAIRKSCMRCGVKFIAVDSLSEMMFGGQVN